MLKITFQLVNVISQLNFRKILALIVSLCLFNLSTVCMAHAFSDSANSSSQPFSKAASQSALPCHVKQSNLHVAQHEQQALTTQDVHQSPTTQTLDHAVTTSDHTSGEQSHHQCALACNLSGLIDQQSYSIKNLSLSLSTQSDSLKDNTPRQAFLRQLDRPPQAYI